MSVLKTDIVDVEYLKNILGMICWYEPKRNLHTYISILQRLQPFWDILIVSDEPEVQMLKNAIKLATSVRLKSKDLSFVRNEVITSFPQLKDIINSYRNKNALFKDVLNDLLAKYKSFAAMKFAKQLQNVLLESISSGKDSVDLYEEINRHIQEFYNEAQLDISSTEIRYSNIEEVEERIQQRIEELIKQEERKAFIPSRISLLNFSFANMVGYEKSCIYMFGAPTGGGKTRFSVSEGAHMYQSGFTVCHITIENNEQKISDLYDSALLGIPVDELYRLYRKSMSDEEAKLKVKEIINALKDAIRQREISKLVIKKFRPLAVTPLMIENYLISLIADDIVPDVLIVDHIDIVVPNSGRRDNMFQAGEEVVAQLKDIAERFNVCLILPTQLNREGNRKKKKKNPYDDVLSRADVSRSGAKYELVDLFATLNRTPDEKFTNRLRLYIDKNRDGIEDLIIPCHFDTGSMELRALETFSELGTYQDSVMIPKSLAVLYLKACQDEVLRTKYVDRLKEFLSFLPFELRPKAEAILAEFGDNYDFGDIANENKCKFLQPYEFVTNILKLGNDGYEISSVDRDGNIISVDMTNSDTGEVEELCTNIDELQSLMNEYDEDDEQYTLISGLLEAVGIY
jgi:hypothetical protein